MQRKPPGSLLHPRSEFLRDFLEAPQNKIRINNLSPVYQVLFFVGFEKHGNTGNISTSSAPKGQRDPAFSQRIAHS